MSKPPPLRLDNKSAIDLAYNPEHHSKTKHIERRHYFIRECVENGKLRVPFVPTADNVADFFTKPLTGREGSCGKSVEKRWLRPEYNQRNLL